MRRLLSVVAGVMVLWGGMLSSSAAEGKDAANGRSVVVWVSVDGLRADYVEKFEAPFLRKLMREGAYTKRAVPPFPSLTFPSHVSQVTGVPVERHGIPGNNFYDAKLGKGFSYPDGSELLEAEPIWITAARQGVRAAVAMWPMSYAQTGAVRSAYYAMSYPQDWDDERRLMEVVRIWEEDKGEQRGEEPLRLLIGYVPGLDTAGHRFGPNSERTGDALKKIDGLLEKFVGRVEGVFRKKMREGDRLYVLVTTDHGMADCHTYLNLEKLAGEALPKGARVELTSTVAHVFFDRGEAEAVRGRAGQRLKEELARREFLAVYLREELPAEWGARHATRVGDVVVVARPGYAMSTRAPAAVVPVGKLIGMNVGVHGYPAEWCGEMMGFSVLWRSGEGLGGRDLGEVRNVQWHATVARLLGVKAAEGAAEGVQVE